MAARIRKYQQEEVRSKIQATQLVKRLTDHALNGLELSTTQIKAIEILLKKTVPDLTSVEMSTDPDNPMHMKIEQVIVDPKS